MFKKLNSKLGLTFLIVLALLIVGVAYILYTSDSDDVKSARQNSEGRLVESDDVVVERAGIWTAQEAKSASSGSYLYSSGSPDDVLTLTFVGSRVEVIYTTGTNLGTLAVDVDRTVLRTVITADQATQYQERTVVDYLDDGLHTLRVYAQEGGVIGIDAFKVSRADTEAIVIDSRKLPNSIIQDAQSKGRVCVDVALQDPEPASTRSPGQLRNLDLIRRVQDEVLTSITTGKLEVTVRYGSVPGFGAYADLEALLTLHSNPLVVFIDPCIEGTLDLESSVPHIRADDTRNYYNVTGAGMVIAVIDTGIDPAHPDLSDAIIHQQCGHVSTGGGCPPTTDKNQAADTTGHGTTVAGVITANGVSTHNGTSTGIPLIGVAPNAKIVAIRWTNSAGGGGSQDFANSLDWVYLNATYYNIDAVNISAGFGSPISNVAPDYSCDNASTTLVPQNLKDAVINVYSLGIRIFASTGNQGSSTGIRAPACLSRVIAIGGTDDNDLIYLSGNSDPAMDYWAPGVLINTTGATTTTTTNVCTSVVNGTCVPSQNGTSYAAPHAAAVGLLLDQASTTAISDANFRNLLSTGATNVTQPSSGLTRPRINAFGVVESVLLDSAPGAPANDFRANAYHLPVVPLVWTPTIGQYVSQDYEYIQDANESHKTPSEDIALSSSCGGNSYTNTVWYWYSDNSSYDLSLSTVYSVYDNDPNNLYDTVLAVYHREIPSGTYTLIGCNDDINLTNKQSAVNFEVDAGETYYIMVARKGTVHFAGPAGLHLLVSRAPAGDTLVTFNATDSIIRIFSSLRDFTKPIDSSVFPAIPGTPAPYNRRWVMGDWDGDGKKTPGFYSANGVFYTTNTIGTTSLATWTGTWFGMNSGYVGNFAVAGRFDASVPNDCVGVIDSGNFPPYGVAFALYYTCNFSDPNPNKTFQWLSVLLPDVQGFTGAFQFMAGDFGTDGNVSPNFVPDGIDTIAVRRSQFVAFTNTPPTTINATYPYAQYLDFAYSTLDPRYYGTLVAGDWDSNGLDSFGIYFNHGGTFHYRNNLEWNNPVNIMQGVGTMGLDVAYGAASWRETTPIWPTP